MNMHELMLCFFKECFKFFFLNQSNLPHKLEVIFVTYISVFNHACTVLSNHSLVLNIKDFDPGI